MNTQQTIEMSSFDEQDNQQFQQSEKQIITLILMYYCQSKGFYVEINQMKSLSELLEEVKIQMNIPLNTKFILYQDSILLDLNKSISFYKFENQAVISLTTEEYLCIEMIYTYNNTKYHMQVRKITLVSELIETFRQQLDIPKSYEIILVQGLEKLDIHKPISYYDFPNFVEIHLLIDNIDSYDTDETDDTDDEQVDSQVVKLFIVVPQIDIQITLTVPLNIKKYQFIKYLKYHLQMQRQDILEISSKDGILLFNRKLSEYNLQDDDQITINFTNMDLQLMKIQK